MPLHPNAFIIYKLIGYPIRDKNADPAEDALPPRDIDLSQVPLHELQRIFHAGPNNQLLERRHVNDEKAHRLQAYCSEQIDTTGYWWEFLGKWSDQD